MIELLDKRARAYSAQISYINKMIAAAIATGGDIGGPYFSDEEGLKKCMKNYLEHMGLSEVYKIAYVECLEDYSEMLQFVRLAE